jgi:hypothetical protein
MVSASRFGHQSSSSFLEKLSKQRNSKPRNNAKNAKKVFHAKLKTMIVRALCFPLKIL